MKKQILFLCLLTLGTLLINSCSKENNDNNNSSPTCTDGIQNGTETGVDCGGTCPACPKPNGFTYKGTFYKAELFGIYNYGTSNPPYDIRVLISTGEGWDELNNKIIGDTITEIKLRTINYIDGNILGVGDYFHSASSTTPGTIYGGYESFCFKGVKSSCMESPNIVGGNLKVSKAGSIYTLEYSLTLSNGQSINGYYKGELDYVTED